MHDASSIAIWQLDLLLRCEWKITLAQRMQARFRNGGGFAGTPRGYTSQLAGFASQLVRGRPIFVRTHTTQDLSPLSRERLHAGKYPVLLLAPLLRAHSAPRVFFEPAPNDLFRRVPVVAMRRAKTYGARRSKCACFAWRQCAPFARLCFSLWRQLARCGDRNLAPERLRLCPGGGDDGTAPESSEGAPRPGNATGLAPRCSSLNDDRN